VTPAHATFPAVEHRFREAIAAAVGIDPDRFERTGTSIVATPERSGWRTASAHQIGAHTLVWCDPDVQPRVASLAHDTARFPIEAMQEWAAANGAVFVGGARAHLIDSGMLVIAPPPDDAAFVQLDAERPGDKALIEDLVSISSPDDAEAAMIDLDALDPTIVGLRDATGRLVALASEHPWDYDRAFADIAVLVRAERRRTGWGRAAVAALCRATLRGDRFPLYRANWDREASTCLAKSVGFRQVGSVAAVRFEEPPL
jgi:hypothetical protein